MAAVNQQASQPPLAPEASCGCSGWRTCTLCEVTTRKHIAEAVTLQARSCPAGGVVQHTLGDAAAAAAGFTGAAVHAEFITKAEEADLAAAVCVTPARAAATAAPRRCPVRWYSNEQQPQRPATPVRRQVDSQPWKLSQSGRRKQDYGPRANFKKKKLRLGGFTGLPPFAAPLVQRLGQVGTRGRTAVLLPPSGGKGGTPHDESYSSGMTVHGRCGAEGRWPGRLPAGRTWLP